MKQTKKIAVVVIAVVLMVSFVNVFFCHDYFHDTDVPHIVLVRPLEALVVSNCTLESLSQEIVPVLEQCRIDCGNACSFCGQVYSFCLEGGFLASNFSQDACNIAFLDYIPVSDACPYATSLERCCNSTLPSPPPPPPVGLECNDQANLDTVYERLVFCQQDCGSRCTICGQVWNYCKQVDALERSLNYTVEACAVLTLDSIPTSNGLCPFNATLEQCCFESPLPPVIAPVEPPVEPPIEPPTVAPVEPPVQPPVTVPVFDCTDNDPILTALETCQNGCSNCTTCDQVYSLCLGLDFFTSNASLDACMVGELSSFTTTSQCPFGTAAQDCCQVAPPQPECGTTDLETYAAADACLSRAGSCSVLAVECGPLILDVVDQDQAGYDCINSFINLQTINCQNGLSTGYALCCNSTVPEPRETPVCPLTTSRVLNAYECISRETTGPTCFDRVDTCDVFLSALTNETVSTDCLNATVSESTNLDDCDFFTNLIDCCNSTVPEPPVQPPTETPVEPPSATPVEPPSSTPVEPPITPPVSPPFSPPTALCTLITESSYQVAVTCFTDTPTSCTQKGNNDCVFALNNLSNNQQTLLCLRQGTNTSTNAANCDIETVIDSCCSPEPAQLCPPSLSTGEVFAVFNTGNNLETAGFGYTAPGSLTVSGNIGWSAAIYEGPTAATGFKAANQIAALGGIASALSSIGNLPSTGALPTTISISRTFLPGIYKNTVTTNILSNVNITLDAQGNPYAVFVFYTSFSWFWGTNVRIILVNGAHPSNVFFTTNNQLSLGANSVLNGNFIKGSTTRANVGGNTSITGRLQSIGSGFLVGSGTTTITRLPNLNNPTC